MIHGYMPRGNIDEDLYVPKGRPMQGCAVGILSVNGVWAPYPPGRVDNPSTYDFPYVNNATGKRTLKDLHIGTKM